MGLTFADVTEDHPLLIRMCTRRRVLGRRLRQVAAGIIAAKSYKIIAYELGTTEGTVKVYAKQLFQGLAIGGRLELAKTYYTMALQELQAQIEILESERA